MDTQETLSMVNQFSQDLEAMATRVATESAIAAVAPEPAVDLAKYEEDEKPESPEAKKRFEIEKFVTPDIIEFMKVAPKNPVLRAKLHSIFLREVPAHRDTYRKMRKWIETNIDPETIRKTFKDEYAFRFNVYRTYKERGRADYVRNMHGEASFHIKSEDLDRIVMSSNHSLEAMATAIAKLGVDAGFGPETGFVVRQNSVEIRNPDIEEISEENNRVTGPWTAEIRDRVRSWIRQNRPELYDEMGL